jgi:hypothetical protein
LGKPATSQAEVGARAGRPGVLQRRAAAPADVDLVQRAGHGVEADGEDDGVDRVGPWRAVFTPAGVIASIGVLAQVDQV